MSFKIVNMFWKHRESLEINWRVWLTLKEFDGSWLLFGGEPKKSHIQKQSNWNKNFMDCVMFLISLRVNGMSNCH